MTTVFCIDFDETLSNTDRLRADLEGAIRTLGGDDLVSVYASAYERVRREQGTVRMPLVLKALAESPGVQSEIHRQLAEFLHTINYQEYLYPGAEGAINRLKEHGKVVLFSDGDAFFQAEKIYSTSVAGLVDGVVILPSKVDFFDELENYWPADKYVFIDDKQRVLDAAKAYFGERSTTAHVQQGRYVDPAVVSTADIKVSAIGDVAEAVLNAK